MPLANHPDVSKATVFVPEGKLAIDGLRFAANRLVTGFTPTPAGLFVVDVDGGPSKLRLVGRDGKATDTCLCLTIASVEDVVPA